jgi:glutamate dehydrogenase (NAD(P)+)
LTLRDPRDKGAPAGNGVPKRMIENHQMPSESGLPMETNELLPREIAEIEEESDPLLAATLDLEEAARYLDLEDWIVHRLRQSEREISLNLPVTREGGDISAVGAIRVQHHTGGQPTLGPVRLSRDAHPHLVRAAAMDATWQLSLLGLPFGGAAGALWCDPAELSERELQEVARAYVHGLRGVAGPFSDVLSPGPGCNEQTMAWMASSRPEGDPRALATVVGKPVTLWGVPGNYNGIAIGVVALAQHILDRASKQALAGGHGKSPDSRAARRVSVQGFGTTGRAVAELLHEGGARVVAVADASGGLYNSEGLDIGELRKHLGNKGVLFGCTDAEAICNADVLESDCDILVLAATERQITTTNAGRIRARLVIEATRGAITRPAEEGLAGRGIKVVPYLIATAGALVAAYLEWAQNTGSTLAPDQKLGDTIAARLRGLYDEVSTAIEQHHLSPRHAALLLAVRRVATQMRLAGRA